MNISLLKRPLNFAGLSSAKSNSISLVNFLSKLPAAVCICDVEGLITYYNRHAAELWGREPVLNDPSYKYCGTYKGYTADGTPVSHDQWWMAQAIKNRQEYPGEEIIIERPDGSRIFAMAHASPIFDDGGNLVGGINILVDISDHKKLEQDAHENEERYRAIVTNTPECVKIVAVDGSLISMNDAGLDMIGAKNLEEVKGASVFSLIAPAYKEKYKVFHESICRGNKGMMEFDIIGLNGIRRSMDSRAVPMQGPDGAIHHLAITREVTAHKKGEEAQSLLAAIVESSEDAIVTKTLEGRILSWNQSAERLFGYTAAEAVGQSISMLIPVDRLHEEDTIIARLRRRERIDHYETLRLHKSGKLLDISLSISPLYDKQGNIIGASKIARDITEQRRLQEAIREADRRKDEFLATLAHELRNPLAPIKNALHILETPKANEEVKGEARKIMMRQTHQMERLINDLMDASRVSQGKIDLQKGLISLNDVISVSIEIAKPLISEKGHSLIVSCPEEPVWLDADMVRLSQVFANLLNNAAKYTNPNGRIEITVTEQAGNAIISITDNGIGIPTNMLPSIFDMFVQVDSSLERKQGGLGIGLTLVRALVNMHSGTVFARSPGLGKGTEFIVQLPLAIKQFEKTETPQVAQNTESKHRVLVVDDNEASAKTLVWTLELMGHEVSYALRARDALELAAEIKPEVILLDIGLPDINGFELCKLLRQEAETKNAFIIAQTGWGQKEHRQKSKEAGFDYHLVKPIDMQLLKSALETMAKKS